MYVSFFVAFAVACAGCAAEVADYGPEDVDVNVDVDSDPLVSWRGGYETGDWSQWPHKQCFLHDAVVTSPVRTGRYAARFRVRPGDDPIDSSGERCEVYGRFGEAHGVSSWWAWSVYFPDTFRPNPTSSWNIFTQWHADSLLGQPNVSFEIATYNAQWTINLRVNSGDILHPTTQRATLGNFRRNRWLDFVVHAVWREDATGLFEVWLEGTKVATIRGANLYPGLGVYLKQGFYRGESALTTTLFMDRTRRGDSFAAVTADLNR